MRFSGIIRGLLVVLCVTALLTLAFSGRHLDRSQRGLPLPGMIRPVSTVSTVPAANVSIGRKASVGRPTASQISSAAVPASASTASPTGAAQHTAALAEPPPLGENLEYLAPADLAGYAGFVDGTSFAATLRKGRPKGCVRVFQV